jgi:hypothetical protein
LLLITILPYSKSTAIHVKFQCLYNDVSDIRHKAWRHLCESRYRG